ncbi:hypothetical protein OIU77_009077 [Salix suchowensis]|uniref:Uncharacterized protein n=1 Tax=Salix suchowensis TaxID=1278906 RepID=A0ABQ9AEC7_9ROSI|nr:hypothetical protein OIU77_009077 [Salix suchowensis]
MGWSSHGGRRLSGLVFSFRYKYVCVCDVGFDGSGNIEWQSLLGGSGGSNIRYQGGGRCCTTTKKRLGGSKLKRQAPPFKENYSPLKAGTEKARGSGSGSLKTFVSKLDTQQQ